MVHAIVTVDESITHADNFPPGDVRMAFQDFTWQPSRRLADQLHCSLGGKAVFPIRRELLPRAL
ncbi:MAG TPA: hypothetical protein VIM48_10315 [Chthoniobacterales bacterium]